MGSIPRKFDQAIVPIKWICIVCVRLKPIASRWLTIKKMFSS